MQLKKQTPMVMQMVLGKASKIDLIRTFGKLSMQKIIEGDYPTLGSLTRDHGIEKTEKVMAIIIHDLNACFGGNELKLLDVQEICAEVSSSNLRNLSMEDIYLVCRQIKSSDSYGKLTVNKVLKGFAKHFEERCNAAATLNFNRHLSGKFVDRTRQGDSQKERQAHRIAQEQYLRETPISPKSIDNE